MPTPALIQSLREGYGAAPFRRDAVAGLTVAIVALPLSMAIAIASGAPPQVGLYTAVVGGFLISALGGSRHQIGGPAGAFIVLVGATVAEHGLSGMILATMMAGAMMVALGLLRLGGYARFIPYPVTVGFTAGIAVIIFASQIKDLLGLTLTQPEPGPILQKLGVIWASLPSANPVTIALAGATIAMIWGLRRWAPRVPSLLVAVAAGTAATAVLALPTPTIQSAFGAIPPGLPVPALPPVTWDLMVDLFPNALAFTLLGAIEALLSALVADGMTGERHDSDMELIGQGVANLAVGVFGGMVATGTIARTATNVRAGAHGPVSGMLAALFVLAFLLVAAPLAGFIPLAALAGVLATVAWNMIEKEAIWALVRSSRADAVVLAVTLGLTVFRDLTEAIVVGFALGSALFIHRMSQTARATPAPAAHARHADDPDIAVYRIDGAFFFGAAAQIGRVLDGLGAGKRALIVDFAGAALLDSSAVHTVEGMVAKAQKRGMRVVLTGTTHDHRVLLFAQGLKPPRLRYESTLALGLSKTRHRLDRAAPAAVDDAAGRA